LRGRRLHPVADSDIIIASENAQFLDTHVIIGLINGVESAGLAYRMPLGIVMRMVIEGKYFCINAQQAYQWGLVSEVVSREALMSRAWEIATHIAEEAAPLAVQGSKKAILGALDRGPTEGIPYTWTVLTDIQDTEDTKEGFRTFVERRRGSLADERRQGPVTRRLYSGLIPAALMIAPHFAESFRIRAAKLSGPGTPALAPCLASWSR
jgi:1,4-dihydroxy-2-naphthoyl-CoA synthase